MAPLKIEQIENDTLTHKNNLETEEHLPLEMHPEAYKVKGPLPEKMKSVSASLRNYAHGLYGLL
ncbi:hypothetical protein GCM10022246_09010 [Pedobacter ginsengiterrae]|uniref:Uncharacterized protein n=1 Tax=Pedobacter ginsengiterrae TaxID=871696 RepID=A0ABP7P114_9SPHI|nr:hypothetical protein [Pedobacter aquatilis]RZL39874.1 MAG: hypothetical protein EOO93_31625 [Pedobacter sp.]